MPSSTMNAYKTKKAKSQAKEERERLREEKEAMLPLQTTKLYDNGAIMGDPRKVWIKGKPLQYYDDNGIALIIVHRS